jgi:hypothetical protein
MSSIPNPFVYCVVPGLTDPRNDESKLFLSRFGVEAN